MATPLAELGQNTEIDENRNGETIIRNTQTGTEIRLTDFVDVVGPLGDSSNPVPGESHFESVNTGKITISDEIDFGEREDVTISSGAISTPAPFLRVFPESGPTGTLTTINGGEVTQLIILTTQGTNTINVEHDTGNIVLGSSSNMTIENGRENLTLFYDGVNWIQLAQTKS